MKNGKWRIRNEKQKSNMHLRKLKMGIQNGNTKCQWKMKIRNKDTNESGKSEINIKIRKIEW